MSITRQYRFNKHQHCPICGGFELGQPACRGYYNENRELAYCTNSDYAGSIRNRSDAGTYLHKLKGECKCGGTHGATDVVSSSKPATANNNLQLQNKIAVAGNKNGNGHALPSGVLATANAPAQLPRKVAEYLYENEHGEVVALVERREFPPKEEGVKPDKTFRQYRPDPDNPGKFLAGTNGQKGLYKLPELLAYMRANPTDGQVIIAEGEKCVNRLTELGMCATTNIGGCGIGWQAEYDQYFSSWQGSVYVLPDNDERGKKHAAKILEHLSKSSSAKVKIVSLPGLEHEKDDVFDWLAKNGNTPEKLLEICQCEPPVKKHRYTETELDEIPPVGWLLPPFLQSNAINLLSGEPGSGKTYIGIDWAKQVAVTDSVLYIAAEDPSQFPERIKAWNTYHNFDPKQSKFYLETLDLNLISLEKTLELIEANNDIKPALVVVDTYSAATEGAEEINNGEIETILSHVRLFIKAWGCAVLLIHHFNKSGLAERGGSGLKGGVMLAMKLHLDSDSVRLEFDKVRNAPKPDDVFYRWEYVNIPITFTDGTKEIRSNRVPVQSDNAVMDKTRHSPRQLAILKWLGSEMRRSESFTNSQIHGAMGGSERTCNDDIAKLKVLGFIRQSGPKKPYQITDKGLELIDPRDLF